MDIVALNPIFVLGEEYAAAAVYVPTFGHLGADEFEAAVAKTDERVDDLLDFMTNVFVSPNLQQLDTYQEVIDDLKSLPSRRNHLRSFPVGQEQAEAFEWYKTTVYKFMTLMEEVSKATEHTTADRDMMAYYLFMSAKQSLANQRVLNTLAFEQNKFAALNDYLVVTQNRAAELLYAKQFKAFAKPEHYALYEATLDTPTVLITEGWQSIAATNDTALFETVDANEWYWLMNFRLDEMLEVEEKLAADIIAFAEEKILSFRSFATVCSAIFAVVCVFCASIMLVTRWKIQRFNKLMDRYLVLEEARMSHTRIHNVKSNIASKSESGIIQSNPALDMDGAICITVSPVSKKAKAIFPPPVHLTQEPEIELESEVEKCAADAQEFDDGGGVLGAVLDIATTSN
jgi:CHASE3 domain sensor protein